MVGEWFVNTHEVHTRVNYVFQHTKCRVGVGKHLIERKTLRKIHYVT